VCLIGIGKLNDSLELNNQHDRKPLKKPQIFINPGPNYQIKGNDSCFYISLVKEENFDTKLLKMKIRKCLIECEKMCFYNF
jgi:hypothetical protein